jgi:hypothetical protein
MQDTSLIHILSPKQIAALPEFFKTALPDVIPTTPEEKETTKGSLHPGEPWVHVDAYSFDLLPLHAHHFTTEEGFRPLPFIRFAVQDKEPYILGTAGCGEPVHQHILISYPCRVGHNALVNDWKDLTQLQDDYPFSHLIQMALISINDPGVFVDIYRY